MTLKVTSVWKNFNQKLKKIYWVFVTDSGERYACFDREALQELGLSEQEKVHNFNPPKEMELNLVQSGENIYVKPFRKTPAQGGTRRTIRDDATGEKIDRMNALRTAVMFLEFSEDKSFDNLKALTSLFEIYVKTGSWG